MLDILDLYVYWNSSRGTPFLNLAFPVPFSGKRVNFAQKKRQEKGRKNKQMEEAVSSGRKKRRSAN